MTLDKLQKKIGGAALGSMSLAAGNLIEQAARIGRNMLLARILMPEKFGVFAILIAAVTAIDASTEVGVRQAVIQSNTKDKHDLLSAAWVFAASRGLMVALMLFFLGPLLASFFRIENQIWLFRLGCLSVFANSFISPAQYASEREMKYSQIALVSAGGAIAGITTTIILALIYRETWALMVGFVSESIFRCLLSYIVFPFKPSIRFSKESWSSLSRFGTGMLGMPIFVLIYLRCDVFILGRTTDTGTVGRYVLSATIAAAPFALPTLASRVLLPIFARHQKTPTQIVAIYRLLTTGYFCIYAPLILFMAVFSGDVLSIIYGATYTSMATVLSVQFLAQAIYSSGLQNSTVFMALGKPSALRNIAILRAVLLIITIPYACQYWGALGAAASLCVAATIGIALQQLLLQKQLGIRFNPVEDEAKTLFLGWVSGGLICYVITLFLPSNSLLRILAGGIVFFAVFCLQFGTFKQLYYTLQALRSGPAPIKPDSAIEIQR